MQEKLETRPKVRGGNPIMNAQMQEKDTTMNKQTEMVSMNVIKDKQRHGNKTSKLESISRNKILKIKEKSLQTNFCRVQNEKCQEKG